MTESNAADRHEPAYQLEVSRIFPAPPVAVRRALADASLRAQWIPAGGRSIPDPAESADSGLLTWAEQPGVTGGDSGVARNLRIQLHDEPGGRTRLELRAGPYTTAEETDARAWWTAPSAISTRCWSATRRAKACPADHGQARGQGAGAAREATRAPASPSGALAADRNPGHGTAVIRTSPRQRPGCNSHAATTT